MELAEPRKSHPIRVEYLYHYTPYEIRLVEDCLKNTQWFWWNLCFWAHALDLNLTFGLRCFAVGYDGRSQRTDVTLVFLFFNRKEMRAKKAWQVKVGQHNKSSRNFPSLPSYILTATYFKFTFPSLIFCFLSLTRRIQSSTSSSRREPKPPRWSPAYRRPPAATRVQRRAPPAARSQRDRRTLCLPCRPPTFDLRSPALDPTSWAASPKDRLTWHWNTSVLIDHNTTQSHYRDLYELSS